MSAQHDPLFVGFAVETPNGTMDTIFPLEAQATDYVENTLGISMSVAHKAGWKITPLYRAPKKPCECGSAPPARPPVGIAGMVWATPSEAH